MIADTNGEPGSQKNPSRLPSLMALRCFAAAARTQNFSQAADNLHLTHGAVSRAVRMLEDDLGLALFERRNRGVFLTEAGRRLQRAVDEGFGLIEDATRALRRSAREAPLVLSCEPTLLMRWLIPRWPDFQARHPEAAVHLVAGGGPFSFDGGIDLAIRRNDFEWPASVQAQPLFEEKIGPVCSPHRIGDFFDNAGASPSLRSDAVRLHTRTRPQAWPSWTRLRGASADTGGREQVFEHFYFSLQAAIAGLGVAIGPWHLVCDDLASGVLAAPLGFVADGSGYFLLSPQTPASGRQRQLLDWLLSVV